MKRRRMVHGVNGLLTDLRLALRRAWKSPAFTSVAVLSLALGMGANITIFAIVDALLLQDPPFRAPGELVNLYRDRAQGDFDPMSYPDFRAVEDATREVFQDLGGYQRTLVQRETPSESETVVAEMVTGDYLPLLGIRPALGRTILPEDQVAPGAHPVVMVSHGYWERAFEKDPGILGRSLRLNGRSYTVVGVAPEAFPGSVRGITADLFLPVTMMGDLMPLEDDPLNSRGSNAFFPVGRLKSGASHARLVAILAAVASDLHETVPGGWQAPEGFVAVPTQDVILDPAADRLVLSANLLGLGLVGLLLVMVCVNLTSFLLARSLDRRKEAALRRALGASRRRLVRQHLTESLALAGMGGLLGLLSASWFLDLAGTVTPPASMPLGLSLSLDGRLLLFALVLALAAGVLVGLLPALYQTRTALAPTLKDAGAAGRGRHTLKLRRLLVAGQTAVSVILLVAASLLLRSFQAARVADPGFGERPAGVLSFMIPSGEYSDEEGRALLDSFREEAGSLPGVEQVGVISNIHLNTLNRMMLEVNVDGVPPPQGRSTHQVDFTSVDEGFFAAAGISLLNGRTFGPQDREDSRPVAVVNEAMARRFWPNRSSLGQTVRIHAPGFPDPTVVGVVSTARIRSLGEEPTPFLYLPYSQEYNAWVSLLAVTRGDPRALATALHELARRRYPDVIVTNVTTLEDHVGLMVLFWRLSAAAAAVFAGVALLLAIMGLYGVVSYSVARQSREMAIRLSVGASPATVVGQQLREGLRVVAVGGTLGLLGAWMTVRIMADLLFGVSPSDPLTFLAVGALLGVAALLATYLPARRASRVDPVAALRLE